MKSDVIRKRSRHEIRRPGLHGTCSETPSASPGASRRASPARGSSPQLSAEEEQRQDEQKTPQFSYDYTSNVGDGDSADKKSPPNDMLGSVSSTHDQGDTPRESNITSYSGFPGPYHPDYLYQYGPGADLHRIQTSFNGKPSEYEVEDRGNKRRRLSSASYDSSSTPTDPPPSATSLPSGNPNNKSPTSSPSFSSYGLPYSVYNMYQGYDPSSSWMQRRGSSSKIHPPMVLPEDAPMEFLHPPMALSAEASTSSSSQPSSYLHPPMLPVEESPMTYLHPPMAPRASSPIVGYSHPPMLPSYWSNNDSNFSLNDQQSNPSNDNSHMEMFEAMMNPME
jgi:hypothetical protein